MLARIRKAQVEKGAGFTLIELLVVMVIIAILTAIAIPVFMNQRQKAVDTAVKADLKTIATAEETAYNDTQSYTAISSATPNANAATVQVPSGTNVATSPNNTFTVALNTAGTAGTAYCIVGTNSKGSQGSWVYISNAGGIQPKGTTACPSGF